MVLVKGFLNDESGQDLIEYTLLLAFIALASAAIVGTLSTSSVSIWRTGSNFLSNAAISAS